MVVENQTKPLPPRTKELTHQVPDQMAFQWKTNQQGVVNCQPHGDDHLWDPIPCEPTAVDSSVDSLGNLIVRGTPGYVNTDTGRRQAIVLSCYEFKDQHGQPIPSHLQGRLWVTDIFATQLVTHLLSTTLAIHATLQISKQLRPASSSKLP